MRGQSLAQTCTSARNRCTDLLACLPTHPNHKPVPSCASQVPKSIVIIGSGYIAVEFAGAPLALSW